MRRVNALPNCLIAEHQSERLEPFQNLDQFVINESTECAGHTAAGLADPAEQFDLDPARKQGQTGQQVALHRCERLGVLLQDAMQLAGLVIAGLLSVGQRELTSTESA